MSSELPIKSAVDLVNEQAAAMNALATVSLDFSVGSYERALVETNAGVAISLESLNAYAVAIARAQTSFGADLDSWCGQFNFPRIPAQPATGDETFSRYTSTAQANISVGVEVYSISNGVTYSVTADTTNPNFSPRLNAYVLPAGISSITIPIVAQTPGIIGNSLANQITTLSSVVPYVDFVFNPSALDTGQDAESDSAYRSRFILYINGLSKGTYQALLEAVSEVPGVQREKLTENKNLDGSDHYGYFYALVDDGTGTASPDLLSQAYNAVYNTRGFTIQPAVFPPTQYPINISMSVTTDGSTDDSTVQNLITSALSNYINSQSFSAFFAYSEIPKFAYDADNSVLNVFGWTLNSGNSDVQLTGQNIPIVGTLSVVVN